MKTIYILLTRSDTFLSKLVQLFTADPYTHASISFDECLQPLYSSARKNGETMFPAGPTTEVFHRGFYYKHQDIPCALYELSVPDQVYELARREAQQFARDSDLYSFNILGLILCKLGIPFHPKYKYFCSQFVAEILQNSGAAKLERWAPYYLPHHLRALKEMKFRFQGNLMEYLHAYGILKNPI